MPHFLYDHICKLSGGLGLVLPLVANLPDIDSGRIMPLLSSLIVMGSFFTTFSVSSLIFFLTSEGTFLTRLKKYNLMPSLINLTKKSLLSSLLLVLTSVSGFLIYREWGSFYYYILFFVLGFSAGAYASLLHIMILVATGEGQKGKS